MKSRLPVAFLTFLVACTIFLTQGSTAWAAIPHASALANQSTPTAQPDVLCLPGVYAQDPGDCLPAGPSAYLSAMAQQGMTFPIKPLPATKPDAALTYVDYRYGLVRNSNAPVFASAGRCIKRQPEKCHPDYRLQFQLHFLYG